MTTMNNDVSKALQDGGATTSFTPFSNFTASGLDRVRQMYAALVPTRASLAVLFALDAAQTEPTEQWTAFFIETASAQVIWETRPTGVLNDQDARWALARFDEAPSLAIIALLIRVTEEAHRLPAWFAAEVKDRAALFHKAAATAAGLSSRKKSVPYLRLVA
jgi:hypothetical protein